MHPEYSSFRSHWSKLGPEDTPLIGSTFVWDQLCDNASRSHSIAAE